MDPNHPPGVPPGRERGVSLVEVMVATMVLAVGALGVLASLRATATSAAVADHRFEASRLATSELETIRSWRDEVVAVDPSADGYRVRHEGRSTVTDPAGRVDPVGAVDVDGTEFTVERHVTWAPVEGPDGRIDQGYKLVTVVVRWNDVGGDHEVRFDTGLHRNDP